MFFLFRFIAARAHHSGSATKKLLGVWGSDARAHAAQAQRTHTYRSDSPTACQIASLLARLLACLLACLLARSLARLLACLLTGLLACLLACWLAGWLACLPSGWLASWLAGCLAGWLAGWPAADWRWRPAACRLAWPAALLAACFPAGVLACWPAGLLSGLLACWHAGLLVCSPLLACFLASLPLACLPACLLACLLARLLAKKNRTPSSLQPASRPLLIRPHAHTHTKDLSPKSQDLGDIFFSILLLFSMIY